jgi:hypothetical protein
MLLALPLLLAFAGVGQAQCFGSTGAAFLTNSSFTTGFGVPVVTGQVLIPSTNSLTVVNGGQRFSAFSSAGLSNNVFVINNNTGLANNRSAAAAASSRRGAAAAASGGFGGFGAGAAAASSGRRGASAAASGANGAFTQTQTFGLFGRLRSQSTAISR